MGAIPGKRETMKDRFIKVLRRESHSPEGFIILRFNTVSSGEPNYVYKILRVQRAAGIEKNVKQNYNDDMYHVNRKNHRLVSLLFVDGKHDLAEILYGLDLNEDYIITG